jgi:acetyltransferase-like isoleucine patch superfamily enzyme
MFDSFHSFLRSLKLLRHPEIPLMLGEMRFRHHILEDIRASFPNVKLAEGVEVIGYRRDLLELGPGTSICHGTVLALGDEDNGYGKIAVGSNTWIGQYNNLRACQGGNITIGSDCLISQFCTLVGSNHAIDRNRLIREQGIDPARLGVDLGDDVWLGSGVTVLPGASIGTGAVVGANSVVTKPIPAYEIWAGAPAQKIGQRQ